MYDNKANVKGFLMVGKVQQSGRCPLVLLNLLISTIFSPKGFINA